MSEIRILLTGFGAFPGAPRNPSAEIVARIARSRGTLARLGIALSIEVLPVVYDARARTDAHTYDVILHVGLAGRRKRLCVETRARNRRSVLHPDAAGRHVGDLLLAPDGPATRPARVPAQRLVTAMRQTGAPASASIDAGDYVCNETLWRSLSGPTPLVGFIHVPSPRRSRIGIGAMTAAIEAAIRVLAIEARRRRATQVASHTVGRAL